MTARITPAMVALGRTITEPNLAPDGSTIAFVSTTGGRNSLVTVDVHGGPERVIAIDPEPATRGGVFDWCRGNLLVYAGRAGGVWCVPASGGRAVEVSDITAEGITASPDGMRVAAVVDQRDVVVVDIESGVPTVVRGDPNSFAFDPSWSDGELRWQEWMEPDMPWDASRIVAWSAERGRVVRFERPRSQAQQPRGDAVLCDANGWLNVWSVSEQRPLVDEPHEHGAPSWGMGRRSFVWSPDGARLAFARNELGFGRLCVVNVASRVVDEVAKGVHHSLSWVGGHLVAVRSGGRTPNQLVAYDTGTWTRTVLAHGPVAGFEGVLTEPEPVTWSGDDATVLYGRLYRGRGRSLVVWIHGGPTDQWDVRFLPRVAYFVELGWSVFVPDHRGSTGHGRAFTQALAGRWGELDVSDTIAGVRSLGAFDSVVAMGGSAGGFTALGLLAAHSDVVTAGVVVYPVTDPVALSGVTHRFERHYTERLAAPSESRPNLGMLRGPLLVLQGADDVVVPASTTRAYVERLCARGAHVVYHEYEGEGHGWRRPETVADELARATAFLTGLWSRS
jgi:dipeptidyl aminopeptidase/acylaminoacyl peptidase